MECRICGAPTETVLDLGASPPANWLKSRPDEAQESFPLRVDWCRRCGNLQLGHTVDPELLYRHYLYVTPRSNALSAHYDGMIRYLLDRSIIGPSSFVVEMGSNVGDFLAATAPSVRAVLGVDPAEEIAAEANARGVPTVAEFFTPDVAREITARHGLADVVVARHCLAHNPSPHGMVEAAETALAPDGRFVIENAYAVDTIERGEFDQVYHEHMFYFSARPMTELLRQHGFELVDVMRVGVHGGSIVFVAAPAGATEPAPAVAATIAAEASVLNERTLSRFADRAAATRDELRSLVMRLIADGATLHAYGATAKGTTLLNYTGLTAREIPYCHDSTPAKIGRFMPGSNVEIVPEPVAGGAGPDYFLLTAWNYEDEIVAKVRGMGNERSQFIRPIPAVSIRS